MITAKIVGTGSWLPKKTVTNADLEKVLDTSDEWIVSRTGIHQRHVIGEQETVSNMATYAAQRALSMAGIKAQDLDLIVVGTVTGDVEFPAVACLVQGNLGASRAFAYDVRAVCSGFVFALSNALAYHQCGRVKRSLVIGVDALTRTLDWTDRSVAILFGDGAGAAVLVSDEEEGHGVFSTHLRSDGALWDLIYYPGEEGRHPCSGVKLEGGRFLRMCGNKTFKVAVSELANITLEALAANHMGIDEITWVIPHQANRRIIDAVGKRLGMPAEKFLVNIDRVANTSAASIPIMLDEANRQQKFAPGDVLLLCAFGSGLAWGAALIRW